ncbi:MAG: type II toxin-antitoxin system VapC family toxin [Cyclobacteriaceae bacterium]|nr:MAG: type II toxin-antitoxin system VapC family toxin [Cyclobacteriaceae bacterium]
MSGVELVIDTNILIYLTSGNRDIAEIVRKKQISISVITEMEVRSWPALTKSETEVLNTMLSQFYISPLNESIKEKAIEIRKINKLKLPDAVICATAAYLRVPLLTADQAFKKVKGLDLILINTNS